MERVTESGGPRMVTSSRLCLGLPNLCRRVVLTVYTGIATAIDSPRDVRSGELVESVPGLGRHDLASTFHR